jgi:hypothetical protein
MRRVPSVTASLTIGMYSAKVGAGARFCDPVRRSAGDTPSRDSSRCAASRSAALAGGWDWCVVMRIHRPLTRCVAAGNEGINCRRWIEDELTLPGGGDE